MTPPSAGGPAYMSKKWAVLLSVKRACSALDESLQLPGHALDQLAAQDADQRAADDHPEHAPQVDLHPVRGARPVVAQILEFPASAHRLQIALGLLPADPRGVVVAEPQRRAQGPHLPVRLGEDQGLMVVRVALEHLDALDLRLPARRPPA